jgi:hypothetical protein
MPLNLDSCITGIFVPGNIGASSGQTPIVRVMPTRAPTDVVAAIVETATAAAIVSTPTPLAVAIAEAATAADAPSASVPLAATVTETATAADTPNATVTSASTVTWDAATVTAVTLSNGDLTATNTGTTSANQGARVATASGKTSGKYYFEVKWQTIVSGDNAGFGVGTTASTFTNMGNGGTTGVHSYRSYNCYSNGTRILLWGGSAVTNEITGVAVDLDNRRYWIRNAGAAGNWNNSGTANPATNTGGLTIPAGTMVPFCTFGGTAGVAGHVFTANFGASAFAGAVPSGFTSGWPA